MSNRPDCTLVASGPIDAETLCRLFDGLFLSRFHTRLRGGGDEPLYTPAVEDEPAVITFRSDYVSSALHEVAHWCLAGPARRARQDYGYWYRSDRNADGQRRFEAVEARPQALEWMFSLAMGIRFVPSRDNFEVPSSPSFNRQILDELKAFVDTGLPRRAEIFATHLSKGKDYCRLASLEFSCVDR
ncbi:MAG: elongation factor P hydroxylase [Pseudomonadota bacterium]